MHTSEQYREYDCSLSAYPCVSVVITTYNSSPAEGLLKRAIDSVVLQTCKCVEIIIIDDGSEGPFGGIEQQFINDEITWVCLINNQGVGYARNFGFQLSSGKYIAYLDHDDWWEKDKLEKQLKLLQRSGLEWCYCGIKRHKPNGTVAMIMPMYRGAVYKKLLCEQIIAGSISSVLMSRDLLLRVGGFDESRDVIEDWDLWIRVSRIYDVDAVDEVLVHLDTPVSGSRGSNVKAKLGRLYGLIYKHRGELDKCNLTSYALTRYYRVAARSYQNAMQFPEALIAWVRYLLKNPSIKGLKGILSTCMITLPKWLGNKLFG